MAEYTTMVFTLRGDALLPDSTASTSVLQSMGWYPEAEIRFTIPVDEPLTTENIRKGRIERSDYRGTRLDY